MMSLELPCTMADSCLGDCSCDNCWFAERILGVRKKTADIRCYSCLLFTNVESFGLRSFWFWLLDLFLRWPFSFLNSEVLFRLSTTLKSELRLRLGEFNVLQYRSYWRRTGMSINHPQLSSIVLSDFMAGVPWPSGLHNIAYATEFALSTR